MRHSLSDKSARAATILGAWCALPGAVPQDDIVGVFRDKSKRTRGVGSSSASLEMPDAAVIT
jgi:hypothetical protein